VNAADAGNLKLTGVGQAIRQLRENAGFSQAEMSMRLGWVSGKLSKYETNHLALSLNVIDAIAKALEQRPDVVVLYCLQHRYPDLGKGKIGSLLEALINQSGGFNLGRRDSEV